MSLNSKKSNTLLPIKLIILPLAVPEYMPIDKESDGTLKKIS